MVDYQKEMSSAYIKTQEQQETWKVKEESETANNGSTTDNAYRGRPQRGTRGSYI